MKSSRQAPAADSGAPAVDRAVRILMLVGAAPEGLAVQVLAEATGTPRATLYRILRVLVGHGLLQGVPGRETQYRLGPLAARLGAQAPAPQDLVAVARPVMTRLAQRIRETVKLIVRDGQEALTVAVADTGLDARVTSRVGTRVPLHIGGSQRLLLAHAPAEVLRAVFAAPLERRTARTLSDPAVLRKSLEVLRRGDSVQGQGEGIESVGAAATLVRGASDAILGALVAVYIHPGKTPAQLQAIRNAVAAASEEINGWGVASSGLGAEPLAHAIA